MKRWPLGRRLLVGVAIATAIHGYAIDWNRTHLYNPNTTQADPDFADLIPTIAGVRIGPTAVSLMMLALTAAGYYLEANRIKARQTLLSTGVV